MLPWIKLAVGQLNRKLQAVACLKNHARRTDRRTDRQADCSNISPLWRDARNPKAARQVRIS